MDNVRRIKIDLWDNISFYIFSNMDDNRLSKALNQWIFNNQEEDFSCHNFVRYLKDLNLPEVYIYSNNITYSTTDQTLKDFDSSGSFNDEKYLDLGLI